MKTSSIILYIIGCGVVLWLLDGGDLNDPNAGNKLLAAIAASFMLAVVGVFITVVVMAGAAVLMAPVALLAWWMAKHPLYAPDCDESAKMDGAAKKPPRAACWGDPARIF